MLLTWQRKGRHCFQHSKKRSKAHIKTRYFISLQVCCFSLTSEEKGEESCYKSLVTLWEKTLKAKCQVYRQMKIHYFRTAVAQLNCILQKIHSRVYFSFTCITINLDLCLIVFVQCCNLFKQPIISGLKLLPLHNSCRFPCLWDMYMWGLTNQSCFWPQLPRSFPYRMVGWKLASASVMTVLHKHWLGHETREAIQLRIFETPLLYLMLPE